MKTAVSFVGWFAATFGWIIVFLLACMAIFQTCIGAPTTKPGSMSPDYIQGWTDAGGIVATTQPATQPTTQPATQPTTQPTTQPVVPPTYPILAPAPGDISALLTTKVNHTRIMLSGAYIVNGTPQVTASDLEILCQPDTTLTITPAAGSTSGIVVYGADFDFDGGGLSTKVLGGSPATNTFRLFGVRPRIANCTGDACHNFLLFDRLIAGGKDAGGSDNGYIHGLAAGAHVGGQFILTMSDGTTFEFITVNGSLGEQCMRLDWTSWGHQPTGNTIQYCTFDNTASPFDKAALDLRNCRKTTVKHCTISNARVSELAQASFVGQFVTGFTFDSCRFTHLDSVVPSIDVKSGSIGEIKNCTFAATPPSPRTAINVGTFCTVSIDDNVMTPGPGVTTMAPRVWGGSALTSNVTTQPSTQPSP